MHISQSCASCQNDVRSRRRDFSAQAWSCLLTWGEVQKTTVDQPICDDCYDELRDILIDRSQEVAMPATKTATTAAISAKVAPTAKTKVQERLVAKKTATPASRPSPAAKKASSSKSRSATPAKKTRKVGKLAS